MINSSKEMEISYPLYRLLSKEKGFIVDVILYKDPVLPEGIDEDNIWGFIDPKQSKQLAQTTSKEAALAVLRLFGVKEFHDWTIKGANWCMPLVKLNNYAIQ